MTGNDLSKGLDAIRGRLKNPLALAGLISLAGAGLGVGLWDNAIYTGGSLGRLPIRKMTGMTNEEYDKAMEELAENSSYRLAIPAAVGLALGGTYLGFRANPQQKNYGLTSWIPKTAGLNKSASDFFTYSGYVPEINFSQVINANQAKELFSNDPALKNEPYVRNMGTSIINDAARQAGYVNPTLGDIYNSAAKKISNKLSWEGVTDVAANTMLANATAHLLTTGIGAVAPLSDDAKRNIIDYGTWAAFAMSLFK